MRSMRPFNLVLAATLTLLTSACVPSVSTEASLSGQWIGTATTAGGPIYYEWNLTQSGQSVEGTIYLATQDRSSYGRYEVTGTFDGSTLNFVGGDFLERVPAGADWCSAAGTLTYTFDNTGQRLRGNWAPNASAPQGCPLGASGQVSLLRQ